MQAAAYAVMYEELTGIPIPNLKILIAVDGDEPQIFEEKRDRWIKGLLDYRNQYEQKNLLTAD